jgi:hypothetical protein
MGWKYTSTVIVDSKKINLLQLWRVWSNLELMPKWDHDCHYARLEDDMIEGRVLYIAMTNSPTEEKKCILTRVMKPESPSAKRAGIHFLYSTFLADISFQYEANVLEDTDQIKVTHATEVTGIFSGVVGYALEKMIRDGCDHMTAQVPLLAEDEPRET